MSPVSTHPEQDGAEGQGVKQHLDTAWSCVVAGKEVQQIAKEGVHGQNG